MMLANAGSAGARWVAVALACRLAIPPVALAQAPAPQKIKIAILEGEGAINNIRQRTARETIVQVQDENDRPVAGAVVLFTLPDRGASGTFANGARSVTVTTDAQGRAAATGFRPNNVAGEVQIQVQASYQGLTATAVVRMTSVTPAGGGGGGGKAIAIIGVIGGAAAAGGVYASRRKTSGGAPTQTPTPTTTVSAGAPSVGPPP